MALEYWSKNVPWSFRDLKSPMEYHERRAARFALQSYMKDVIGFDRYPGKDILEIGCGSGIDAIEFAINGGNVTATDFTQTAIEETTRSVIEAGVSGIQIRIADIEKALPFRNNSFDLVYSFGVIHHLKDPNHALSEMKRVLRPNGQLLLMLYNRDSILYKLSIEVLGLDFERIKGVPHTQAYTRAEIRQMLSSFRDIWIRTYFPVVDLPDRRKVRLSLPEDSELGWHHIVRARK